MHYLSYCTLKLFIYIRHCFLSLDTHTKFYQDPSSIPNMKAFVKTDDINVSIYFVLSMDIYFSHFVFEMFV